MRALVTGATGFVGGHLVDVLLARGDEVVALVRTPTKASALAHRGVRLVAGDLHQPDALAAAVEGVDVIYHVAGLTAARNEAEFLATNRDGTARLLAAAERSGAARFLLVSSLAAGGPAPDGVPLTGVEPAHPVTRYGRSKLAAEEVVRASTLPWTILRPPAVYGPGDREMFRVFRAATLGIAPVFGTGSQRLSLVFGPDLGRAIATAGVAGAAVGRVFYPTHPEVLTSRQLVERAGVAVGRKVRIVGLPAPVGRALLWTTDALARLTNQPTVLSFDKRAEFFAPAWLGDPTPLTQATGWSAEHDFASGARLTVDWYRAEGWL